MHAYSCIVITATSSSSLRLRARGRTTHPRRKIEIIFKIFSLRTARSCSVFVSWRSGEGLARGIGGINLRVHAEAGREYSGR